MKPSKNVQHRTADKNHSVREWKKKKKDQKRLFISEIFRRENVEEKKQESWQPINSDTHPKHTHTHTDMGDRHAAKCLLYAF